VLFFGIVREYKGLRDLLIAVGKVRDRLGSIQLLIAGEFWEADAPYRALIAELGIAESVRIDNRYIPNEDASIYFSAADLLVAPYRKVTGSAVVQMARGFGLPVVTTAIGGLTETAASGSGLLAPPRNPEQLAAAIVRYFEDGLEDEMRESIRHQQGRASWQKLVRLIESLTRECRS
jgi:glycosyltransferase involved in cell wall biosynthesis